MEAPKFKIENSGILTKIYVDDKEVPNVVEFKLQQKAGELPTLELYIMPLNITGEGAGEVEEKENEI